MTILNWILLILGIIFTVPTLAFLVMKWGSVGFYRGKEASNQRRIDRVDVTTMNDKKRKYENF